jgi:uncharacterized protein with PQ loop repeat
MLATTFGVGQVAYSILWFFLFAIEIWLMISIFIDIFRSHDLKGWQKALWVIFIIILPLIGILVYFIVRGNQMRAHQIEARQDMDRFYRDAGGAGRSPADELSRLAELRREGVISEEEFQQLKAEVMRRAGGSASGN